MPEAAHLLVFHLRAHLELTTRKEGKREGRKEGKRNNERQGKRRGIERKVGRLSLIPRPPYTRVWEQSYMYLSQSTCVA